MAERISEVRITSGNHPVSSRVERAANNLQTLATSLYASGKAGEQVDLCRLSETLRMLVGELRGHIGPAARDIEDALRDELARRVG